MFHVCNIQKYINRCDLCAKNLHRVDLIEVICIDFERKSTLKESEDKHGINPTEQITDGNNRSWLKLVSERHSKSWQQLM